jgi:cytoskeletal protein RodZ
VLTSATVRRALVALLLAVPLVATGGTAQAAACSGTSGVTVVVQFTSSTVTSCAPGNPSTGTQALTSAGFSVTYVNGQAFVCKINGQPSNQTCGRTPPADAYWAYFHGKRGGSWTYSSTGASTYDPAPGSVEGWRFGDGAKPSSAPPPAVVKPKPKPSSKPTPAGTASASPTAKGTPTANAERTRAAKQKAAKQKAAKQKAKHKKDAARATASASASASATPTSATADAAAPVDQDVSTQKQGGNVPWLWGLVGLVVIGGAAGAVTLVRRH